MKFKNIISALLACAVVGGALNLSETVLPDFPITVSAAYSYNNLIYQNYGNHIEITGCSDSAVVVVIPDKINGVPVTAIASEAFYNNNSLISVSISESVTSIGNSAFSGCSKLEYIEIPESVTSIGSSAFSETRWLYLKQNENPFVVVNGILVDGKKCKGDVTIPDSIISIGDGAFSYCIDLESVTIPNSVTSIGNSAFSYCRMMTSVTIPDSVTSIGNMAFEFCQRLTSVTLPDSVTSIGNYVFDYCYDLSSVKLPNGIKSIPSYMFFVCKSLSSITIPDSVVMIEDYAFANCYALTSVTIPDSVTIIRQGAFAFCNSFTSVTIPSSVTYIDVLAFYDCPELMSITIEKADCEIVPSIVSNDNNPSNFIGTIYGYENSTAQAYAEEYGYKFALIEDIPSETVYGDADLSGDVEIADAVKIMCYVTDPENNPIEPQGITNGDVYQTGDGLSVQDALSIQKYLAQIITELPEN